MAAGSTSVSLIALAGCVAGAGLLFAARPSFAQSTKTVIKKTPTGLTKPVEAAETPQAFEFDIPALPLADALDRYAVITGRPVVFPSKLSIGKKASALTGRLGAAAALRMLLQGTSLVVEEVKEGDLDTFVLKPGAEVGRSTASEAAELEHYDALVQARVWETFCGNRRTAPGNYRALLRFRIDENGSVVQPRLLSSTGDTRRDALLMEALGKVSVGRPPPAGAAEPLTMLILPQGQIAGRHCEDGRH